MYSEWAKARRSVAKCCQGSQECFERDRRHTANCCLQAGIMGWQTCGYELWRLHVIISYSLYIVRVFSRSSGDRVLAINDYHSISKSILMAFKISLGHHTNNVMHITHVTRHWWEDKAKKQLKGSKVQISGTSWVVVIMLLLAWSHYTLLIRINLLKTCHSSSIILY